MRFHVHAHVDDLRASIDFYSRLFAMPPTRVEADYAKWMLDEPRLNFAISTRGARAGVDHLGLQADTEAELAELRERARAADLDTLDEGETTCCYARSDKHWITDPQGIAWEHYRTLADIPVFSQTPASAAVDGTCCASAAAASRASGEPGEPPAVAPDVDAARPPAAASRCC